MTPSPERKKKVGIAEIRRAVANYMASEGCGCCGDSDRHRADEEVLGKLLKVPKYKDGSGRDFSKFKRPK